MKKLFLISLIIFNQLNCDISKDQKAGITAGVLAFILIAKFTYNQIKASINSASLRFNQEAYDDLVKNFSESFNKGETEQSLDIFESFVNKYEGYKTGYKSMDDFFRGSLEYANSRYTGKELRDFESRMNEAMSDFYGTKYTSIPDRLDGWAHNLGGGGENMSTENILDMVKDISKQTGFSEKFVLQKLEDTDFYKKMTPEQRNALQEKLRSNAIDSAAAENVAQGNVQEVANVAHVEGQTGPVTVLQELDPDEIAQRNEAYAQTVEGEQSEYQPLEGL